MSSETDCRSTPSSSTFLDASAPVHPACVTTLPPSSTASTAAANAQPVHEFTGTTIFAPPPAPTYRYAISLKHDRLRIWLEDCDSKKQWSTSELGIEAYVDPTNAIPDATASDYLECFREVMNSAGEGVGKIASTFSRVKGDTFRLEIAVAIQVLRKSRVMSYAFVLEPISVERIDVLESRMRDMQGEMDKLRLEGDTKSATLQTEIRNEQETVVFAQSVGTSRVGDIIRWNSSSPTSVFGDDGSIRMPLPGLYQILTVVNHQANRPAEAIQLMKGSACIQVACSGYAQGNLCSTSLMCVTRIDKNDQLTVKCPTEVVSSSAITLIRLGR
ncbi:hypothetical protein PHYSODRAFT_566045 [Phytophthora sojae]|uniref:C1q domain-containing protein n=1 Tax=Phytophthora sojae (strain P6497) TaxID=1094619 RepID=G5ADK9_PHYSP|nr:hypothetical protein PHYSODRAFT_566045 [Phytophthora sojae]EGZ06262.1 hypothetical protein PHYSODRAFT_566045 [Phytophthora sojae]|eukprot:XP_009538159.1 hypothetical protein PHYSODRAFT_566045 [Phytophthora sojae]